MNVDKPQEIATKVNRKVKRAMRRPRLAHFLRTLERFNTRNGALYAAAITYFSVLSLVPIMMFCSAGLGMVLSKLRPDLLDKFTGWLSHAFGNASNAQDIVQMVLSFVLGWQAVGLLGLVTGLFTGIGWLDNVRASLKAIGAAEYGNSKSTENIFARKAKDVLILIATLVLLAFMFIAPISGSWILPTIVRALHLDFANTSSVLILLGTNGLSVLAALIFFLFILGALPKVKFNRRAYWTGCIAGAVIITVLQNLAPLLVSLFNGNRGAQMFGAVIVIMLLLNIFARVILYLCAWVATADQPAVARTWTDSDYPLLKSGEVNAVSGHWTDAKQDLKETSEDDYHELKPLLDLEAPDTPEPVVVMEPAVVEAEPVGKPDSRTVLVAGVVAGFGLKVLLESVLGFWRKPTSDPEDKTL